MSPLDLSEVLVVGVSSRALFDLEEENRIYEEKGLEAYAEYQLANEDVVLGRGTAFPLVKALLSLNDRTDDPAVEIVVVSRNSPETGLRIINSLKHFGLEENVTRAVFTGGEPLAAYMQAFEVDLFLSRQESDVQAAIKSGFAAARVYDPPEDFKTDTETVRIAFDFDGVLASGESEEIFQTKGMDAFRKNEKDKADVPADAGPLEPLLVKLGMLQEQHDPANPKIRIAVVTARNSPAHERVIRTLRDWGVKVNSAFFLGGVPKDGVLKAFRAHIFFDD